MAGESGRTEHSRSACHRHSTGQGMGRTLTLPPKRPHKSVIFSRSPCVPQVPMATNCSTHKFNKNDNNWLHKDFEPQQVAVVVSSISILALDSRSAFTWSHPLTKWKKKWWTQGTSRLIKGLHSLLPTAIYLHIFPDHQNKLPGKSIDRP